MNDTDVRFHLLHTHTYWSARDARGDFSAGAELWAGLDGPGPAHIDSWPAQSEIKK